MRLRVVLADGYKMAGISGFEVGFIGFCANVVLWRRNSVGILNEIPVGFLRFGASVIFRCPAGSVVVRGWSVRRGRSFCP